MRRLLTLTALWALALCGLRAEAVEDAFHGILPVTDRAMMRSLNGEWHLKVVEGVEDEPVARPVPQPVPPLDGTWGRIPVPGCWEVHGFCEPSYDKALPLTGYYRTAFDVPAEWRGLRVALRLDGVLYGYDLWLNGRYVGSWRSGYNTAVFDLTPYLDKKSARQELAMRVVTQFPGSAFDWNDDWAPCGIHRDVTLMAVPETHLADLTIRPHLSGRVEVDATVAGAGRTTHVRHEILDAAGRTVGSDSVAAPRLWSAETPYLYTLRTTLTHRGQVVQTFHHRFGFRELTIDGNILKLNGRPIKLRGVTSHATDPRTGKVVGDTLTLRDMCLMKEASVNYIRTSHYPREPRFYELADSLGFYVIDEVPFGYGDRHLSDTAFYPVLQQRAQATVRRDKNHASVLLWSLGNENPLTDICVRLGHYVKAELDASRPVCYPQVGSYFRRFDYQLPAVADVYAPHYPTTGQVGGFYQRADRPVIFTEYCHTLGISFEDHDRQWETIERTPCIAGGSVWEWVDQGMPFAGTAADSDEAGRMYGYEERVFTSREGGFAMCGVKGTDGLLYADRTPLPNYYELQRNYARAFVADSVVVPAGDSLVLRVVNRYDFLDLKDNVTFRWALTEDRDTTARGAFSPACPPRGETAYALTLPAPPDAEGRLCLLRLELCDAQGHTFLRQSLRVGTPDLAERLLAGLTEATAPPATMMQEAPLVRAGRKATMAERLKVGDKRLERYLLRLAPDGTTAGPVTADLRTEPAGLATRYAFTLRADTTDTFLSELGVAFLLDRRIDRVQWIGQGPMPTYPGRRRAGRYGVWGLRLDDLYMEGNRSGVDAALLTDAEGNGLLLVCRQGNVSFEQTDRGLVLSVNAAVSGQGPKFARTAFPVVAREVGTLEGDFYLYRVEAGRLPEPVRQLFAAPQDVPGPFRPFRTQYDTYLMRYGDIVE